MVGLAIVRCSVEPRFFSLSLCPSVRPSLSLSHSLTHSFFFTTIIESDERSNRIRSKSLLGIGVV